jgi:hypothetical protein
VLAAAGPVWAQADGEEKSWSFEAGVDRSSLYLFRGVDLLDGESVIVPHATWTVGGLAVSYYGYFGDLPGDSRYGENDLTLDYTFSLGDKASLTLGGLTYQFNGDAERDLVFLDTYEVYGILSFDVPLSPTLTYYRDVDEVDGGYGSFGISHSLALGSRASLDLSGSVGFDFHYNNKEVGNGTPNDVLVSVDLPIQVGDRFSIHAGVQRSIALEALDEIVKADPEAEGAYGDQTVVTVGAALSF